MISNRETCAVIQAFYEAVKGGDGIIKPEVFMTDAAPLYLASIQARRPGEYCLRMTNYNTHAYYMPKSCDQLQ